MLPLKSHLHNTYRKHVLCTKEKIKRKIYTALNGKYRLHTKEKYMLQPRKERKHCTKGNSDCRKWSTSLGFHTSEPPQFWASILPGFFTSWLPYFMASILHGFHTSGLLYFMVPYLLYLPVSVTS